MAVSAKEEMAQQFIGKQAGNWANIAVFEKYKGGQQGWNKGEEAWMAKEEWSRQRKLTYWFIMKRDWNLGGEVQWLQIKCGKKTQKWYGNKGFYTRPENVRREQRTSLS